MREAYGGLTWAGGLICYLPTKPIITMSFKATPRLRRGLLRTHHAHPWLRTPLQSSWAFRRVTMEQRKTH